MYTHPQSTCHDALNPSSNRDLGASAISHANAVACTRDEYRGRYVCTGKSDSHSLTPYFSSPYPHPSIIHPLSTPKTLQADCHPTSHIAHPKAVKKRLSTHPPIHPPIAQQSKPVAQAHPAHSSSAPNSNDNNKAYKLLPQTSPVPCTRSVAYPSKPKPHSTKPIQTKSQSAKPKDRKTPKEKNAERPKTEKAAQERAPLKRRENPIV